MNNQNNHFEEVSVEIIYFEVSDIIQTSDLEMPWDMFSLHRPQLDILNALENSENE